MMTKFKTVLAAAGMTIAAGATFAAAPAAAQVNGIATLDGAVAVAGATALQTGYNQIQTTYAAQIQQINTLQQQRQGFLQQLDTDQNGDLSEAEVQAARTANSAALQQVTTLDQQLATVQAPIQQARIYVVSQVAEQLSDALQQVVAARSISVVLTPEAIQYAPAGVDVTQQVTQALNTRVPSVQTAVPADWRPSRQVVQLFQEVQQVLLYASLQQQAAQAQQGGVTPQPQGR